MIIKCISRIVKAGAAVGIAESEIAIEANTINEATGQLQQSEHKDHLFEISGFYVSWGFEYSHEDGESKTAMHPTITDAQAIRHRLAATGQVTYISSDIKPYLVPVTPASREQLIGSWRVA